MQKIRSDEQPTRIANAPAFMVVIVLSVRGRVIGAVVDSVPDVQALGADSIKPAPELGSAVDTQFILGMGCVKTAYQYQKCPAGDAAPSS